jgi:hypothetical protein
MGRESKRRAAARGQTESGRPLHYGYFLVAFVDLLGQREELAKLAALPHTAEARPAVEQGLKRTAARVVRTRKAFGDFFRVAATNRQSLKGLSPTQVTEYNRMRSLTFHQIGFSDSFVISVPLRETAEFGAATAALGVWAALYGLTGMSLASLAEGVPLRAGIDVERGIDIFANEVYGPALVNAYQLECKVAQYPRSVVGDGLLRYLDYLEGLPQTNRWSMIPKNLAPQCRRLICEAPDDGRHMLHMLSGDILALGEKFTEPASVANKWARQERHRFEQEGNEKLAGYYARLVRYFEASGFSPDA